MSTFSDQILLRFLDNNFITDLLNNQLGLLTLFNLTYKTDDIDLKEITLSSIQNMQFQVPVFETIRTVGTEEQIMPAPERVNINRVQHRLGRLSWVEVLLEILLSTKVHDLGSPIEKITTKNLIEELGGVNSLSDLKNKLEALYSKSIVEAFFKKMRITSVNEFKRRGNLFIEFVYKTPLPYNPNDPQNIRPFYVNVCIKIQSELKITEALQTAKLCRSILENERNYAEKFEGGEVETPYIFVVIFSNNTVSNNSISGLNANEAKTSIENLLLAERMLALFL